MTPSQRQAVSARGNVLVMAGAGTGKTHTLIERCLDCVIREGAALGEILVVTFTEAAAAEMKQRLRRVLEEHSRENPGDLHCAEELALFDAAHIGTLHGFCFKLVREHFYELGLDPQPSVLDEGEARLLADETLEEVLQAQYEGRDELATSVQILIQTYGGARDEKIRSLVLRLHHYAQTRPDAEGWLAGRIEYFSANESADWQKWLLTAIQDWRDEWLPVLENLKAGNEKAAELLGIVQRLQNVFSRELAAEVLEQIASADSNWPAKRKTVLREPLKDMFDEAIFLASVASIKNGTDPLAEDWNWVRGQMTALLRLTQIFAARFAGRKRDDGVLDFHDLEQFALMLLWDFTTDNPTPVAEHWRKKLRFVFVDEYQDINAAQDKIIAALAHEISPSPRPSGERAGVRGFELANKLPPHPNPLLLLGGEGGAMNKPIGNRFLVGDVKQSIYRFRLADPKIFRDYAKSWRGENGQTISLTENFRSRESLLNLVNSVFSLVMREEIGGVSYDDDAKLKFAKRRGETPDEPGRDDSHLPAPARGEARSAKNEPRAELLLRLKIKPAEVPDGENSDWADLEESAREARLVARRLGELKSSGHEIWDIEKKTFRAVEWQDMAVLLRSPSGKAEIFAKEFERSGVPLVVARGGFYETSEILDLLSLLQLLDNPLQDVPVIAVLRSPLVGCSLDELAEIRLVARDVHFWTALNRVRSAECEVRTEVRRKIEGFLERFSVWRKLVRQVSLSQCLEEILAETHYADWLQSHPRGAQRRANVDQFLNLAQRFDQFQRQGLFRFLKFIEAQREAGAEPEVAQVSDKNAVRLMSIHQSKGLEFPVVVVADLAKTFNEQDLHGEIILDGEFGLCPRVQPPQNRGRYPSLPHWLAQRRQRRELRGEELRLLYVAMTRAGDTLILSGVITEKRWSETWNKPAAITLRKIAGSKSFADWIGLWFADQIKSPKSKVQGGMEGGLPDLRWQIVDDAELAAQPEDRRRKAKVELPALDGKTSGRLRKMLEWQYEFNAATRRKAKSSVTELRREAEELNEESEQVFSFQPSAKRLARTPAPPGRNPRSALRTPHLSAAETGTAHHKFLQYVALKKTGDITALEMEAKRLAQEKILSPDECAVLDLEALADFWNSPAGLKIRAQPPDSVKRELPFTARFSPAELAEITGLKTEAGLENEFVVVQGVADLVVLLPKEIWLVDFKTDQVHADELPEKTRFYGPQMKLYASALAKIYTRPVSNCWLHFLSARQTEEL